MPFDLHIIRRPKDLPASVSIRARKHGVTCFLSVKVDAVREIGGNETSRFNVLLGSGDDAGKLRLQVHKDGKVLARKVGRGLGFFTFDLGPVAGFPDYELDRQRCDARRIDDATLEIVLPDWSQFEANEDEPTAAPAPLPRPAAASGRPAPAVPRVERMGIALDLKHGDEAISFKKKTMEITTRQAAVLAHLLRVAPGVVDRKHLLNKALTDLAQHMREASLDMIAADLVKALPGIGLQLKIVKGVGLALAEAA